MRQHLQRQHKDPLISQLGMLQLLRLRLRMLQHKHPQHTPKPLSDAKLAFGVGLTWLF